MIMKATDYLFLGCLCLLVFFSCEKEEELELVGDVCTKMDDLIFMDYCYRYYDVNNDKRVSMKEASAIQEMELYDMIYVYNKPITSLKGIEYFTRLAFLDCGENGLTNLDVSKNTSLTELYCYENQLKSLNLGKNTSLTVLGCSDNLLTSLDVSKNTSLTELDCSVNYLTNLDVSKNTKLKVLICVSNPNLKEIWLKRGQVIDYLEYDKNIATIKYKD